MGYILLEWPNCQEYMEYEGFEEHSSLADCDKFGSSAYFIDEDWIREVKAGNVIISEVED